MPSGYRSGAPEVRVHAPDLLQLKRDLQGVDKTLVAELRRGLKEAAGPVKRQVQANASWSKRIPKAITIGTAFAAKRTGIFIRENAKRAPHGRALENQGQAGTFRHPVFGNRDRWVAQRARPHFYRGAEQHFDTVERAVLDVMDAVARKAGFR